MNNITPIQGILSYQFKRPELLQQSLTHPSYHKQYPEEGEHNQRLEFLGDALLSAILADALYKALPDSREGVLTQNRAILVNGTYLADLASRLGIEPFIRLSESEKKNINRSRNSILEDVIEAIVGAIYLDSDWETTSKTVLNWFGNLREKGESIFLKYNPKGQLQELVQPEFGNDAIEYITTEESGPDHEKLFKIEVTVNKEKMGEGTGFSKKEAEENAARNALIQWSKKGESDPK